MSRIMFRLLIAMMALPLLPAAARADTIPGVDWYIALSPWVLRVQAPSLDEAKAMPAPDGQQRLIVIEVLKGYMISRHVPAPAVLKPGAEAVVLEHGGKTLVWTLNEKNTLDTGGIPAKSQGGKGMAVGPEEAVTVDFVRGDIDQIVPEETGLCTQVIESVLFPDRIAKLAREKPERAAYVKIVATVRDLGRNVPALAELVASPVEELRAAVVKKLEALTGARLGGPKDNSPAACQAAADAWKQWWKENGNRRVWDEKRMAWVEPTEPMTAARLYPPLTAAEKAAPAAFPPQLLAAIEKRDAEAFAPAYRAWADSGARRDRDIEASRSLNRDLLYDRSDFAGTRLLPNVVLNPQLPAELRMQVIATMASSWNNSEFSARIEAARRLMTPAERILDRIGPWDKEAQQALEKNDPAFIEPILAYMKANRDLIAARVGAVFCGAGHVEAVPVLLEWLKDKDPAVRLRAAQSLSCLLKEWPIEALLEALAAEKDPAAEAEKLVPHLADAEYKTREETTQALIDLGKRAMIPVRSALAAAKDPEMVARLRQVMATLEKVFPKPAPDPHSMLLTVIARSGDKRGLEVLLAALRHEESPDLLVEVDRGLARIKDPKALPLLARLALEQADKDQRLCYESMIAFGYISGLFTAPAPPSPQDGTIIYTDQLKEGLAAIAGWSRERAESAK
jgi:hypothetical protein